MGGPYTRPKDARIGQDKAWYDKPGLYGEPLGDRIFEVEGAGITLVTRLHEWTIQPAPKESRLPTPIGRPHEPTEPKGNTGPIDPGDGHKETPNQWPGL